MFDYQSLYSVLSAEGMQLWSQQLEKELQQYFSNINHGDFPTWEKAISDLPVLSTDYYAFNQATIEIGQANDINEDQSKQLISSLKTLMPWRKGPFHLFGIDIDAEWRSDMKWSRIEKANIDLRNKMVLDIGSGNGYYALRMLGQGAKYVVGIDPTLRFIMQFEVVKQYLPNIQACILPLAVQDIPHELLSFDTIFSMGVIYHRRDAKEHLKQIKQILKPDGELILEGLVIDELAVNEYGDVLRPEKRYAKMNNVWAVPSVDRLLRWLEETGFQDCKLLDITQTGFQEQRVTQWMRFESLSSFIDKDDYSKTIEGYPAARRAIIQAKNN